ncbi:MAG: DUF4317 domain-containing protein [Oscillospiraceae bacterium]|nr:DUF4317 domain-containing protein [Oscillospiraceae bacterium]
MNDKEISEIRRRFRADRSNITHIRGCYVNDNREIIASFDQSMGLAAEEEKEKYLALLKRALSGVPGKNLLDITFRTQQVADSDEHRLLSALRDSALKDEEIVQEFFQKVVQALTMETSYLILLAHDVYDVPYRGRGGGRLADASENQFSYVVCAVCPVKETKQQLCYSPEERRFVNRRADYAAAPPELGFLFPAFDDRSTNLYNALYYIHNTSQVHEDFIDAIFHTEPPMAPDEQRETFQAVLAGSLEEDCSLDVVQTVHEQLCGLIAEHKASREPEPLVITKVQVEDVLAACGVPEQGVERFGQSFDEEFGPDAILSPSNIVDPQLALVTPDVTIKVNPERRDLVETRVIAGAKYILVRADEAVEVNGINIHINQ